VNEMRRDRESGFHAGIARIFSISEKIPYLGRFHADTSPSPVIRVRVIVNTSFACIPVAVIHNNTGCVYEYELP